MHWVMLLLALAVTWWLRANQSVPTGTWGDRWQQTLRQFLLPPLLLVMTAVSIVWMGSRELVAAGWLDWGSYGVASSFLLLTGCIVIQRARDAWNTLQQVYSYPECKISGQTGRLLSCSEPFIAQMGFWQPELVISQGLLDRLKAPHLEAVLVHEQAHHHYRDTFWFFWLGCLRHLTAWLPQTDALWQELLGLRELRADSWAAQKMDRLLLAEALLLVGDTSVDCLPDDAYAALSCANTVSWLTQRIDALLEESDSMQAANPVSWAWFLLTLLPLVTIPFHSVSHHHYCLLMTAAT